MEAKVEIPRWLAVNFLHMEDISPRHRRALAAALGIYIDSDTGDILLDVDGMVERLRTCAQMDPNARICREVADAADEIERLRGLTQGEYICRQCGIRQNSFHIPEPTF